MNQHQLNKHNNINEQNESINYFEKTENITPLQYFDKTENNFINNKPVKARVINFQSVEDKVKYQVSIFPSNDQGKKYEVKFF
jgi:hypothetical protein